MRDGRLGVPIFNVVKKHFPEVVDNTCRGRSELGEPKLTAARGHSDRKRTVMQFSFDGGLFEFNALPQSDSLSSPYAASHNSTRVFYRTVAEIYSGFILPSLDFGGCAQSEFVYLPLIPTPTPTFNSYLNRGAMIQY